MITKSVDIPGKHDPSEIHPHSSTFPPLNKTEEHTKGDSKSNESSETEETSLEDEIDMSEEIQARGILPPKFSGTDDLDVHEFMEHVETCKAVNDWDEKKTIKFFAKSLTQGALQYVCHILRENTEIKWPELKQKFIEYYAIEKLVLEQKLFNASQKDNEKPTEFALRIQQLAKLIDTDLSDEKVIPYILRGVSEQCHTQISMSDNSTLAKLEQNLKTYKKNETRRKTTKSKFELLIERLEKTKIGDASSQADKPSTSTDESTHNIRERTKPTAQISPLNQSPPQNSSRNTNGSHRHNVNF